MRRMLFDGAHRNRIFESIRNLWEQSYSRAFGLVPKQGIGLDAAQ